MKFQSHTLAAVAAALYICQGPVQGRETKILGGDNSTWSPTDIADKSEPILGGDNSTWSPTDIADKSEPILGGDNSTWSPTDITDCPDEYPVRVSDNWCQQDCSLLPPVDNCTSGMLGGAISIDPATNLTLEGCPSCADIPDPESPISGDDKHIIGGDNSTHTPWWITYNVKPAFTVKKHGYEVIRFSRAQRKQFGINKEGKIKNQKKFDAAIAELSAETTAPTSGLATATPTSFPNSMPPSAFTNAPTTSGGDCPDGFYSTGKNECSQQNCPTIDSSCKQQLAGKRYRNSDLVEIVTCPICVVNENTEDNKCPHDYPKLDHKNRCQVEECPAIPQYCQSMISSYWTQFNTDRVIFTCPLCIQNLKVNEDGCPYDFPEPKKGEENVCIQANCPELPSDCHHWSSGKTYFKEFMNGSLELQECPSCSR